MSGSGGFSIARTTIRGENRFYNPPPMRRMQQEAQLQQQIKEKQRHQEEDKDEILIGKEQRKASETVPRIKKGLGVVESKNRVVSGSCLKRNLHCLLIQISVLVFAQQTG